MTDEEETSANDAQDLLNLKIKRAKQFGFPEPIFLNAEKLTPRTRVLYLVEVQAMHIPGKEEGKPHHFTLRFSKFARKKGAGWQEADLTTGFSISDRASVEKLAAYIAANQALLNVDLLSGDFTSVILSHDEASVAILQQILESDRNKEAIFQLFKDHYPELDKKILTYRLVQARHTTLEEFRKALDDPEKLERNFWYPFLKKNQWILGLPGVVLSDGRIDLEDTADFLIAAAEDGFIDIAEIKNPHVPFWALTSQREYARYRDFIQPSRDLRGAITQATNYIFQVEKKFGDPDWQRRNQAEAPVKPRCYVIAGRSWDWGIEERTAYRLLNDSLSGIVVLTFDQLYGRAERALTILEEED